MKTTAEIRLHPDMIHVTVTGEGAWNQRSISAKAVSAARKKATANGFTSVAMISSGASFSGDAWEFRANFCAE